MWSQSVCFSQHGLFSGMGRPSLVCVGAARCKLAGDVAPWAPGPWLQDRLPPPGLGCGEPPCPLLSLPLLCSQTVLSSVLSQFLAHMRGLLYVNSINLEDEKYQISICILFFLYQISQICDCRRVQQNSEWLSRLALSSPQVPASRDRCLQAISHDALSQLLAECWSHLAHSGTRLHFK